MTETESQLEYDVKQAKIELSRARQDLRESAQSAQSALDAVEDLRLWRAWSAQLRKIIRCERQLEYSQNRLVQFLRDSIT